MTLVFQSLCVLDGIVNPIYKCLVKITPDINPENVGLERACPWDSKNVSFIFLFIDLFRLNWKLWVRWGRCIGEYSAKEK